MMKVLIILTLFVLPIAVISSCSKGSQANNGGGGGSVDCNTVANKNFAADVNPIIQNSCNQAGCHNTGSINGPGPLTNFSEVFNARFAIRTAIAAGTMPKNGTLTTAQRNSIICWVDSGAHDN